MDTRILEQIGFSKNEVKVYFALLELEQSSATPIVRKARIPNSKVYPILDKLIQKGLVSSVIKNNVKYFQASDPQNLVELIKNKGKELEEQKRKIEELVPQIQARRKEAVEKQEAVVYEGIEGVRAAFMDMLETLQRGEEYYVFTLGQELERDDLKLFLGNFHARRVEKGIKAKLIAKKNIKETIKSYRYKGMQTKFTDINLPTGIFIYKNKVMTVVWEGNPTAFVISSENNAQKYKEFFEEIWGSIKK